MCKKIKNLLAELANGNGTLMLAIVFTDMFFVPIMFLVYELPVSMVIGLCSMAGTVISGIVMSKVTYAQGKERGESLIGKLCYFPVDLLAVKKAQYGMAFKIIGIQLLVTLAPLLIVCFRFKWQNAMAALVSIAISMLIMAVFLIEINHIVGKRK